MTIFDMTLYIPKLSSNRYSRKKTENIFIYSKKENFLIIILRNLRGKTNFNIQKLDLFNILKIKSVKTSFHPSWISDFAGGTPDLK